LASVFSIFLSPSFLRGWDLGSQEDPAADWEFKGNPSEDTLERRTLDLCSE
jgi:hypothetical protein